VTEYTRSIATNFTSVGNNDVNYNKLYREVLASAIASAVIDSIKNAGDSVYFNFKTDLSAGDQTLLTTICNDHLGGIDANLNLVMNDGRQNVIVNMFDASEKQYFNGKGDNIATGIKDGGPFMFLHQDGTGDEEEDFQFLERLSLAGGSGYCENPGDNGSGTPDTINFKLVGPSSASAFTQNVGAGAYDKLPVTIVFNYDNLAGGSDGFAVGDGIACSSPEWTGVIKKLIDNGDNTGQITMNTNGGLPADGNSFGNGTYTADINGAPLFVLCMMIPNGDTEGDWDINLTAYKNRFLNTITKAVPIPCSAGNGFFDWNSITNQVLANTSQTGGFNLFDQNIDLAKHVRNFPLDPGAFNMNNASIKPSNILAHWKMNVKLSNVSGNNLKVRFRLLYGKE